MAEKDPRLSGPTLKLLRMLLEDPAVGRSGAEISRSAGIGAGTLYPLLARLEAAGWLNSEWENINPSEAGRPRRRFYRLTPNGRAKGRAALEELQLPIEMGRPAWI